MKRKIPTRKSLFKIMSCLLMLLLCGMVLAGCKEQSAEKWGLKEFTLVLLPGEDSPENVKVREVFAQDLSEYLGIKVNEYRATDYSAMIEGMRTGEVQLANFGPFSYVHAVERSGAECIAVQATDGKSGYQSYIVTQKDSDINSLEDLEGKSFAFVDPESTSGNVVPCNEILNAFPEKGLTFDDLHLNGTFFGSVMFAGNHSNSLQGVAKGDVDAAAVSSSTYTNEILNGNVGEDQVKIIHESPNIPSSPWAIQKDLPQELKDKVTEFFLNYDNEEYFYPKGKKADDPEKSFIAIEDSEYDYIRELRDKFNLTD